MKSNKEITFVNISSCSICINSKRLPLIEPLTGYGSLKFELLVIITQNFSELGHCYLKIGCIFDHLKQELCVKHPYCCKYNKSFLNNM